MLVDELKALATHLPPSLRVAGAETADVLSALVAYAEHGQPVVDAAHQGPQELYDFFHNHLTKVATDAGEQPPRKGQPLQRVPEPGRFGPPPAVSRADFAELKGLVEQLLAAQVAQAAPQPAPAASQLTPDQILAAERAVQMVAEAQAHAHDTPESD